MHSDALAPAQKYDFYSHGLAGGHQDIFTPFLGPQPRTQHTTPYAKKATAKWNMPEAYIGKNEYLGDTMEDLMLTAKWDWYTERIFPWYKTDQIHLQWTSWENNPHYMGITPHQATSRVVTQRRSIRRASIVRRGIAYEFENDFIKTPMGRSSFMASLAQMARSVQETANVEVLSALLNCHRYTQIYTRKHGIVADGDLDGWLDRKAERFMIAQKSDFGLEILSTQIEADQEMYGGQADVWILGREVMDYCSLVPEGKIFYHLGGQEAVDRVNGRSQNGKASGNTMGNVRSLQPERMIGTTPVFLAKSKYVDSIGKANLLSRTTEAGVYNLMVDRCRDYSRYSTESRNIRVYDNDIDAWSDIELIDAIEHCGVWDDDGNLADVFNAGARGRAHGASVLADEEYDFLSFMDYTGGGSGRRKNIQFIGDMAPSFLKTDHILNAARTMLHALAFHNPEKARELESKELDGPQQKSAFGLSCREKNVFATYDRAQKKYGHVTQIVPTDPASPDPPKFNLAQVGAFLTKVLGAAVPAEHAETVEAIAADHTQPWQTRAEAVKQLVVDSKKRDPTSVPSMPNEAHIDKWYNKQVKDFSARIAAQQQQQQQPESVESSTPVGSDSRTQGDLGNDPAFQAFIAAQAPASQGGASSSSSSFRRQRIGAMSQAPGARSAAGPSAGDIAGERKTTRDAAVNASKNRFYNMAAHFKAIDTAAVTPTIKFLAKLYIGTPMTRDCLLTFARSHVLVPLGFLLMRPHCTYRTRYGIKCASGGRAGYTFFGHSSMEIEHEAARKVGFMHYTAYLSAVATDPRNVYVVEDLFCEKYLGGMGVEFWSARLYKAKTQKRNSRSIICAPLPPTVKRIETKMDVRGRWYTEQKMGLVTQDRFDRPLYPGAGRINHLFGLYDGGRKDKSSNRGRIPCNYVCWQGHTWYFNTVTKRFDDYTVEAGNFGPKVYPGCGLVRNGAMKYLKDPNYESVHA